MLSDKAKARLGDIIEDARRIESFVGGMTIDQFIADDRTIFAIERLLQRITEAAIQIPPAETLNLGFELPIAQMRALGNRLRHEYRDIDRSTIFHIAQDEVPALREAAARALNN